MTTPTASRSGRVFKPAAAITNPNRNDEPHVTSVHRAVAAAAQAAQNRTDASDQQTQPRITTPQPTISTTPASIHNNKRPTPSITTTDDENEHEKDSGTPAVRPPKRTRVDGIFQFCAALLVVDFYLGAFTDDIDSEGMHRDVHVTEISSGDEDEGHNKKNKDPTADLKHFFKDAPRLPGSKKARVQCESCK